MGNEKKRRVIVYHGGYGCDSGCCGHWVQIDGDRERFDFGHPATGEDFRTYAEELIAETFGPEHVKDLDWKNSYISTD